MQSNAARDQLARWGLDDHTSRAAGLFEVTDARQIYPEMPTVPAIVIPYWRPDGALATFRNGAADKPFARLRMLSDLPVGAAGWSKKKLRYLQPGHSGVQVYFPPLVDWAKVRGDPAIPLIITEGEAKALAAARYGFTCIALGGVYSYATPGGRLHVDLEALCDPQRAVYIVFDSDAATNPNVVAAEARLVQAIQLDRGAKCYVVRLPATSEDKVGLDDYLRLHGPDAFEKLLLNTPALSPLDARIVAMNRRYAWIDRENMVYGFESRMFIRKEAFTSGSLASSETFAIPFKNVMKEVPLAPRWLVHTHAQRYSEAIFRPGEGRTVEAQHGPGLNLWTGWPDHSAGDVKPWLRLTEFLFRDVQAEHQELALKLMAYKAQNPQKKIPICPVLIGDQGTGKTVWADSLVDAFSPYSKVISPAALTSQFQGWLETSLLAATHEMTPADLKTCADMLKGLISDMRRMMNEKFRPAREILSFTQYIITSNHREVGAFAADDRRMFVVDTPQAGPEELYNDVWQWREAGGGHHLLHYLVHYPLKGWEPPQRAPMTAGKLLAAVENASMLEGVARDMKHGDCNFILSCVDMAAQWAAASEMSNDHSVAGHARAVASAVKNFPIRPWYTPDELAILLPWALEMSGKGLPKVPGGVISRQLRNAGIRYLVNRDDTAGFLWKGRRQIYLVVADQEDWSAPIGQADFERAMNNWPVYSQLRAGRPRG